MQNKVSSLKAAIVRSTLADSVYETLLEAIFSGQLAPGTELSVVGLAQELEVSRTPVAEALRHLAQDGLVEQEVNRKARVATFTSDDVREIFEMRKLLECAAAELAAKRIAAEELRRLRDTAERLEQTPNAVDWSQQWADFDEDFHETIARATGNKRLCADIVRYRMLHRSFNRLSTTAEDLKQALAEHLRILDALEGNDGKAARKAMHEHVAAWQEYFVEHLPGGGPR